MNSSSDTCCVCLETQPFGTLATVNRYQVCHECIRQTFQRALDYEGNYPPRWGRHVLDVREYTQQSILTREFLSLYHQKEREYRCPPINRVYCSWSRHRSVQQSEGKGKGKGKAIDERCNGFLGARTRSAVDVLFNNGKLVVNCKECGNLSCRACEDHITNSARAVAHKCLPARASDTNDAAFEGLRRGRDFQLCPFESCQRKIELMDGCNHVRCICGMQFCFICGQPAMDGSGHWTRTDDAEPSCPRYNERGAIDALYDVAPVRGLYAGNPLIDEEFANRFRPRLDDNIRSLRAAEGDHTVRLTLQDMNAVEEAISLQEHYDAQGASSAGFAQLSDDSRVLNLIPAVQAEFDQTRFGPTRRRLTIATPGPAVPAPALLTGPQGHGHPYHTEPKSDIAVDDEEDDNAFDQRTQLHQHQFRIQRVRQQVPRLSEMSRREFDEAQVGGSRDLTPLQQTPRSINSAPGNASRATRKVQVQKAVQQPGELDDNPQPAVRTRTAPRFPSAADVEARRRWHSMLPVRTNPPIASDFRSAFGLVPGPRSRSAPLHPLPPLLDDYPPEDAASRSGGQGTTPGPALVDNTGSEGGKRIASRRDSGIEED